MLGYYYEIGHGSLRKPFSIIRSQLKTSSQESEQLQNSAERRSYRK
jgi:hypothetical protein